MITPPSDAGGSRFVSVQGGGNRDTNAGAVSNSWRQERDVAPGGKRESIHHLSERFAIDVVLAC
jgi:hypothetical protein